MSYLAYYKCVLPKMRSHNSDVSSQEVLPDSTQDPEEESLPDLIPPLADDDEAASSPASPEQEIVDVESYQPCVVDLTCEDEDEVDVVEIVAQEQPVIHCNDSLDALLELSHCEVMALESWGGTAEVHQDIRKEYVGTEQRRMTTRRQNANANVLPLEVEDLTLPERQSATDNNNENSNHNNNNNNNNNNNAIPVERQPLPWHFEAPSVDFHNPNLLFGNLLEEGPVTTVDDHNPRHRPSLFRPRVTIELRPSSRYQRSRSRSPQLPDFPRDAPRTPEFLQDLDELLAEVENRRPLPRVLGQTENPLTAAQIVAQEHHHRVAQITAPEAPPSPPPPEQPTISCLVCLDSLATIQNSSRSLCSTVCGHVFCSSCIEEVVKQRKQCPVCRKKLTKKQYHPLFI
ncbi:uncharacterized protein [Procambarus clarkii]|uniref:uncharacterized protein isoform X3 n=1 Tax=Procambarus clarkii TaxID=6728 RepID=UPI0037443DA3